MRLSFSIHTLIAFHSRVRFQSGSLPPLACAIAVAFAGPSFARVLDATVAISTGDSLGPSAVSNLNTPFTDGAGRISFLGTLEDGQRFIWWDTSAVFFSNDALPFVLTGGELSMGASDTGEFIYSPSVDGEDAVYTNGGPLLVAMQPIPSLPGRFSTFNSRPMMLPDGTSYWVSGSADTPKGGSTNRHLLRATDPADSSTISVVLSGGDVIEGKTIDPSASNFDFWISDDGSHHIHVLDMLATPDIHVYLDGAFVAIEGGATGQGTAWQSFDIVGVNDAGNYFFTGDTDGATATDEFIAYNGAIVVQEGDTLDGTLLASGFALRAAAINDLDQVAHVWGLSANEHLFVGPGVDLRSSRNLLAVGDSVDVNGDEVADYQITDFNASTATGPGLDFAEDGYVWVEVDAVDLSDASEHEIVVGVRVDETSSAPGIVTASSLRLRSSGPNPFTSATRLECRLERTVRIDLALFDVEGRRVHTLYDGMAGPGVREFTWDGSTDRGTPVASGVYFARLAIQGEPVQHQRIVRIR